ncbi:MAG TPA: transcriptional regulator [bacterium]|nr:transcriptional regulator [bacterium]
MSTEKLTQFVKERRKMVGMTQLELSQRSGTGLRFIRELEQGKTTLRLDKVNQVLALFGHEMAPVKIERGDK